jgi:hypothetical protein
MLVFHPLTTHVNMLPMFLKKSLSLDKFAFMHRIVKHKERASSRQVCIHAWKVKHAHRFPKLTEPLPPKLDMQQANEVR